MIVKIMVEGWKSSILHTSLTVCLHTGRDERRILIFVGIGGHAPTISTPTGKFQFKLCASVRGLN